MTYSLPPAQKPLAGSRPWPEDTLGAQSRETGLMVPNSNGKDTGTLSKGQTTSKSWAHFVAGG